MNKNIEVVENMKYYQNEEPHFTLKPGRELFSRDKTNADIIIPKSRKNPCILKVGWRRGICLIGV
jgi:hypothetical protein